MDPDEWWPVPMAQAVDQAAADLKYLDPAVAAVV